MASFNEDLASSFTRHAVDLSRFEAGVRRRVVAMLRDLERELVGDLASRSLTTYQQGRLTAMLKQTRETIATAMSDVRRETMADFRQYAKLESDWVRAAINRQAGVELASVAVPAEVLRAAVSTAMLDGVPQAEWWDRQTLDVQDGFSRQMRLGIVSGETTDQIVGRVRTLFEGLTTANVTALARTGLNSVATAARLETYMANDDVIEAVQQRSTLDARTTAICQAYSGKVWSLPDFEPVGHKLPWNGGTPRHFNCRSTIVPVVKAFSKMKALKTGGRSTDADSYFRRRLDEMGLEKDAIDRAVRDAQASLDGQVSEDWNYETWLRSKSDSFQQNVLGPSKYRLWKKGKLSFTQLVDETGRPLRVSELKKQFSASLRKE